MGGQLRAYMPHTVAPGMFGNTRINAVITEGEFKALAIAEAVARTAPARPPFVIDRLLPEGGTCMIAAAPKIGKSGLAVNAALAVVKGEPFLGVFRTRPGRAVYIQTEIPRWAMTARLRLMDESPEGLSIWNPGRLSLNWWEEDGFNKRRETGNRERTASLIAAKSEVERVLKHGVSSGPKGVQNQRN